MGDRVDLGQLRDRLARLGVHLELADAAPGGATASAVAGTLGAAAGAPRAEARTASELVAAVHRHGVSFVVPYTMHASQNFVDVRVLK